MENTLQASSRLEILLAGAEKGLNETDLRAEQVKEKQEVSWTWRVVEALILAVTVLSHQRSQRVELESWRNGVVVVVVVAVVVVAEVVAVVVEGGVAGAGCHGLHCWQSQSADQHW